MNSNNIGNNNGIGNLNNGAGSGPGSGAGNMMDMMKSNLMTMMMFKSMNHGSGSGSGSSQKDNSMFDMIYIFFITQILELLFRNLPLILTKVSKYSEQNLKSNILLNSIVNKSGVLENKEKSSSITIQINISDHDNIFGQALLDFITNNDNTKHVSFKKQNFILNQSDIIEIADELFIKLKENNVMLEEGKGETEQLIELFSYTKTMQELRSFLNKLAHEYNIKIQNKLGDKIYYFNQHPQNAPKQLDGTKDYTKLPNNSVFTMKMFQTNRKFSNLFGPEISVVKKRVDFFTKNRKWYDSKGIPYTLGLLLSGQAGAGKTSSIKCLANETKRHIININLNNDITKIQLENLFFNEMIVVLNVATCQTEKYHIPLDQRIYVLEDIDCQSDLVNERSLKNYETFNDNNKKDEISNQNTTSGAENIDLAFLLNLLDGVLEIPGRIVVMTSNYPDKLDHALIRPGRIDVIANFKKCSRETLIEMIEFFYDIKLTSYEKTLIQELKDYFISPAEMSKLMFENFNNYNIAIDELKNFYKTKEYERIEKEKKIDERRSLDFYDNSNSKIESESESENVTNINELKVEEFEKKKDLSFNDIKYINNKFKYDLQVGKSSINKLLQYPLSLKVSNNFDNVSNFLDDSNEKNFENISASEPEDFYLWN